ncbi:MAG: RusA family crossover junction endodeoxyribonuclease [bacterium]|nr:RusA family crossover junction endodeoxyribonuclease [bacterium]
MIRYELVIPGTPVAWQRTGGSGKRRFTQTKTKAQEELIAWTSASIIRAPIPGPLRVTIRAWWPSLKPDRKKNPRPAKRKDTQPDADNVGKLVLDGLQKGGAFHNDGQVAALHVFTWHAAQGDEPRTEIDIEQIEGE